MMLSPRLVLGSLAATLAFGATVPSVAHHSRAMFDTRKSVELTGTVREFQWTNPHCYIQLVVRNDAGHEEEWSVELGAPLHLQGRGWGARTFRPGDRIRMTIAPLRNGDRGGELQTAARLDGRPLGRSQ